MQWRILVAAVLFLAWSASAVFLGKQWGQTASATREAKQLAKDVGAIYEQGKKTQRMVDKLPKAERKHADVVRANPAGCDRPVPVSRSLHDSIGEANASRALPRNP
jgi:hypothetical protein